MKKNHSIIIILFVIFYGCSFNNNENKGNNITQENIGLDSFPSQKKNEKDTTIKKNRNKEKIDYKGEKPIISFINDSVVHDTINFKKEYIIQIKIPGIPDSLVSVAITDGKISRTNNKGEYKINPKSTGLLYFSIGYKDSLNTPYNNFVSEERIVIK